VSKQEDETQVKTMSADEFRQRIVGNVVCEGMTSALWWLSRALQLVIVTAIEYLMIRFVYLCMSNLHSLVYVF